MTHRQRIRFLVHFAFVIFAAVLSGNLWPSDGPPIAASARESAGNTPASPIRGQAQHAGSPILVSPAANETIDQNRVTFTWQPPQTGPAPSRYQVCVADEGQTCQQPGALIFPSQGQPAITGRSYTAHLPPRFQGKRFQMVLVQFEQIQKKALTIVEIQP